MADTNQQVSKVNPIKALDQAIAAAKNAKELLSIDQVSKRFIANYQAATGRKDGLERYEQEKFAFMEIVNNNPDIMQCDPFSIFAGFVKAGSFGLSFTEPHKLYAIAKSVKQKDNTFKKVLSVESSAHGKKELLERMPNVKRILPAQVVFSKDVFKYSPLKKQVTVHEQDFPLPNPSEQTVIAAYARIEYHNGDVEDVVLSVEELKKARAASKMQDGGKLWTTHYGEAAKKSVYNRMFKEKYRKPDTAVLYPQFEPREEVIEAEHAEVEEADQTFIAQTASVEAETVVTTEAGSQVVEETGEEVVAETVEEPKTRKKGPGKQESFI